jgi:gluconate kinase
MPASLLDSQLATLEPPADALEVDAAAPPEHCAQVIAAALTRP